MSDHPAHSAESRHSRENSTPTTWSDDQSRPQEAAERTDVVAGNDDSGAPQATYSEFHTPGYGIPAVSDPEPRPLSGFRSEQRFNQAPTPAPLPTEWTDPFPSHRAGSYQPAHNSGGFPPSNPQGFPPSNPEAFAPSRPDSTPPTGMPIIDPYGHSGPYFPAGAAAPPPGAPLPPPYRPSVPPTPYPDLATSALLRPVKPAPAGGWRLLLYKVSGKLINVGESPREIHRHNLVAHVNQPLQGCYKIALLSLKGGVGKTTITATLGGTFATVRGDRVVAVDANPDRGTLSQKVPLETPATVRHLLRDAEGIERYSDIRQYTSQGASRLEVLASESDPAVSEAFSSEDYTRTLDVLEKFYSLVLTDCGTGLMHSAMSAVLANADALIVVSSGSVDGARSASATLDWLDAHGHEDLVRRSVCVINAVRPRSGKVDMQKVVDHFSRRCRAVRLVPFDPHLEEGAEISLERLRRETRDSLIELAAVVADGFPGPERAGHSFS